MGKYKLPNLFCRDALFIWSTGMHCTVAWSILEKETFLLVFWALKAVCETNIKKLMKILCQKYLFIALFQGKCATVLQWQDWLSTGATHSSLKEIGTMELLLCKQIRLPMQDTVTVQKVSSMRESRLNRRFCTSPVRYPGTKPRPFVVRLVRPSEGVDFYCLRKSIGSDRFTREEI